MLIVGGSNSQVLSHELSKELGVKEILLDYKKFPDGETYVRIPAEVNSETVAVVQSMAHNPDEYLMEYFLLVRTLRDLGAKKIVGVIPYFAYARQDARFRPGEAISLHIVRDLLEQVGTDMLITFDLHLHREGNLDELFNIPVVNLTAMEALAGYIVTHFKYETPIVIAPDEEAEKWAKVAAKALGGASFDVLAKKRDVRTGEIEIAPKNLTVEGKDVLIVDDIISTGGTMATAVKMTKVQGAKRIVAACTHPLLIGGAYTNILRAGADALIGTNSIESPVSVVSIAPIIAKAISDSLE